MSLSAGASSILTLDNRRGMIGMFVPLADFLGWYNSPEEGTEERMAWAEMPQTARKAAETVIYAVQTVLYAA